MVSQTRPTPYTSMTCRMSDNMGYYAYIQQTESDKIACMLRIVSISSAKIKRISCNDALKKGSLKIFRIIVRIIQRMNR